VHTLSASLIARPSKKWMCSYRSEEKSIYLLSKFIFCEALGGGRHLCCRREYYCRMLVNVSPDWYPGNADWFVFSLILSSKCFASWWLFATSCAALQLAIRPGFFFISIHIHFVFDSFRSVFIFCCWKSVCLLRFCRRFCDYLIAVLFFFAIDKFSLHVTL